MEATFVSRVCAALSAAGVRYAVAGGYAVALHGAVRGTVDVDIVLAWSLESLQRCESALNGIDLLSRLPIGSEDLFQFRDEYVEKRNLIAWNFFNPTNPVELVDVLVAYDLAGRRRKRIETADGPVLILGRRDLIEMKRASGRSQDLEDANALERLR